MSGATAVKFGTSDAASFVVVSDTTINAVEPAHFPGRLDVTVTTPGGTSAPKEFKYYPTVTKVVPNEGPAAGGTSVTVTGTIGEATIFRFSGSPARAVSCTTWNPAEPDIETSCTMLSPPGSPGTVDVKAIVARQKSPVMPRFDGFTYR